MEIFQNNWLPDIDSAAFWLFPTSNGDSDHLVIGQSDDAENYPFYRTKYEKIAFLIVIFIFFLTFF